MINYLLMNNFKCFSDLKLPLGKLNLLTGFNAAGKSTSLQSLLLLAQFFRGGDPMIDLPINGGLVSLGRAGDVINKGPSGTNSNYIEFGAGYKEMEYRFRFEAQRLDGKSIFVLDRFLAEGLGVSISNEAISFDDKIENAKSIIEDFVEFRFETSGLIYLSADRVAGEQIFTMPSNKFFALGDVGSSGEYATCLLNIYSDESVDPRRKNKNEPSDVIRRQVNAWLSEIFPGSQVNTVKFDGTDTFKLELKNSENGDWLHPANIGYGISYALPMIVAGLLAGEGQILIVDSPEAHLHPAAQSAIGKFFSVVAASGVQVILETHSDHVLNGVRLAVKNKFIESQDLKIHFFGCAGHGKANVPMVNGLLINDNGQIDNWPSGFFDQSEIDLSRLSGW